MEEKKSFDKSYAQVVKESGSTPPRKRQDLKISPLKENIPPARLADEIEKPKPLKEETSDTLPDSSQSSVEIQDPHQPSVEIQNPQVLKKVLLSDNSAVKEFNKSLLKENVDLTIGEYIKMINEQVYNIDPQIVMDFMTLVERDDFCIHSELLKVYGIQSKKSSSSHTLKLFEKFNFSEDSFG
jgi:hypothetical protein